jgi:phosphate transport system protein
MTTSSATSPSVLSDAILYDTLVNYLVSMARTVEGAMNRALDAIVSLESPRTAALPSEVFLLEPRINEMEIVIDEHAIRLLRQGSFTDDELRLIVAALKITNDLERIGDIAVNLAQRVVSLREMPGARVPEELAPMASAVRAMVSKSLGALIFRNVDMATNVLESDDLVDQYRDRIFEQLLQHMTSDAQVVTPGLQFILATRHLERIADHATNIAEDIIFWVRGLDVRHGRGLLVAPGVAAETAGGPAEITVEDGAQVGGEVSAEKAASGRRTPNAAADIAEEWAGDEAGRPAGVTNNSHALHSQVTPPCETERA